MENFEKYQSLKAFGNKEVRGIENGICNIYPKLDGSNACIFLDKNNQLVIQSRNRIIPTDESFNGFREWVAENSEKLLAFFEKHPKARLYGEWLVKVHLTYREDAMKKFYAFDVAYAKELSKEEIGNTPSLEYTNFEDYRSDLDALGIPSVPLLGQIENPTVEDLKAFKDVGYLEPSNKIGEGVVVKRSGFKNKYGLANWAKYVFEDFKELKGQKHKKHKPQKADNSLEEKLANKYVTKALCQKEFGKLELDNDGWEGKLVKKLIENVYDSVIEDNILTILCENRYPTINFGKLKGKVVQQLKNKLPKAF